MVDRRRVPLEQRLWSRLVWTSGNCWEWQGALSTGYGVIQASTRNRQYTHRLVYERLVGPIPDGLHLDHLCKNTRCANPAHLDPVPCRTNLMRSPFTVAAINAAKEVCPQGHAYDYFTVPGERRCRTCLNEAKRRWRAKHG